MKPEDKEEIANMVALKLKRQTGEVFEQSPTKEMNYEDLLKKLAEMLVEHRSPCHNFDDDEVHTLKGMVISKMKYAKTKGIVKAGLILFIMKELFLAIKEHLHWGP